MTSPSRRIVGKRSAADVARGTRPERESNAPTRPSAPSAEDDQALAKRARRGARQEPSDGHDSTGGMPTCPDPAGAGRASGSDMRAPAVLNPPPPLPVPPIWPPCLGGVKPRPLRNMMHEADSGGGSCWINSAVQALVANQPIRRALEQLYNSHRESYATDLWRIEKAGRSALLRADDPRLLIDHFGRFRERDASRRRTDERLAITCRAMYDEPLTQVHIPLLMTQRFYRGRQEDAAELLTQRLVDPDYSPCVSQCLRGLDRPVLLCAACDDFTRPATEESFTTLAVPIISPVAPHGLIDSVQDALDAFFAIEPMPEDTVWQCGNPACRSTVAPRKRHVLATPPSVLCVTLNRWRRHEAGQALLHHVHPSLGVTVGGASYALRSIMVHLGSDPRAGHYVTIAHHPTAAGNWWLYNDGIRTEASPDELACQGYFGGDTMKAYVLFYELIALVL